MRLIGGRIIQVEARHGGQPAGIEWCKRHGLDPDRVRVPNVLVIDDEEHTVTVKHYFRLNAEGRTIVDESRNCVVTDQITVQLEARPLPWPLP